MAIKDADYALASEYALEKAKASGSVVVYPKPNQLQLDVDYRDDLSLHLDLIAILEKQYSRIKSIVTTPSNQSNRHHVTITFQNHIVFDHQTRVLLQACLGSDRKREILSFIRVLRQDKNPTLLLEKIKGEEKPGDIRE